MEGNSTREPWEISERYRPSPLVFTAIGADRFSLPYQQAHPSSTARVSDIFGPPEEFTREQVERLAAVRRVVIINDGGNQ
jgi:hypothetical protein